MDMKLFKQHLAAKQKKTLSEAPQVDGKVNQVVWHSQWSGDATMMINQNDMKGEYGVDQAAFALLKARVGGVLRALTRLKVDDVPIRNADGNYYLVHVSFELKR